MTRVVLDSLQQYVTVIRRRRLVPLRIASCRAHRHGSELNSQPLRLDLTDQACRRAKELGVKVVINTDAHNTEDLQLMRYGVATAQRGWLEKSDVLNARSTPPKGKTTASDDGRLMITSHGVCSPLAR